MPNVDWEKIKAEYLAGGTSYRKLGEKYNVSYQAISRKAQAEDWQRLRKEVQHKTETKVVQKIASQRANDIAELDRVRSVLTKKLAHSVDSFPEIPGNRMEQSVTEQIDTPGTPDRFGVPRHKRPKTKTVRVESDLSKIASILKDLMEMTGYDSAADEEEYDDGFLEALNEQAAEVTTDAIDVPEGL